MNYIVNEDYNIVIPVDLTIEEIKERYTTCLANPNNILMTKDEYMVWRNNQ